MTPRPPFRAACVLFKGRSIQNIRPFSSSVSRLSDRVIENPPHPDPQLGSYPQYPGGSNQQKPPLGYWDVQYRRNYGEPLHEQDEALNMFSPDLPHVPPNVAVRQASIAFAGFAALFVVLNFIKPEVPAIRRVYPHDGLVAELGGLEENKARTESLEES